MRDGKNLPAYLNALFRAVDNIRVSYQSGESIAFSEAVGFILEYLGSLPKTNKLMFIGNGGSAAIASHMAIDFAKNGGVRSMAFNDASALTCLANDVGYRNVFADQIEMHGLDGDILIAISSSGSSPNITWAAEVARRKHIKVITLSGFNSRNDLRLFGDYNFYVPASIYGLVETAHQIILHAILDIGMGWPGEDPTKQPTDKIPPF